MCANPTGGRRVASLPGTYSLSPPPICHCINCFTNGLILNDYTTSTCILLIKQGLKNIFFLCLFYVRLSEKEKELEQFRAGKLLEWKTAADNVQMWLVKRDAKFQLFEDLSSDLDEVRQQKSETEVRQCTLYPDLTLPLSI